MRTYLSIGVPEYLSGGKKFENLNYLEQKYWIILAELNFISMKHLFTILLLLSSFLLKAQEINVITYNIRYNTPNDGINAWPNRSEMAAGLLRFHDADIFGLQEALISQINDIEKQLPQMKHVGVGRDDGKEAGEFSPVFFNIQKFKLVDSGWFWLSETPEKPGYGWDAHYNRICTWVKLKPKKGTQFIVFNTHFDHQGDVARAESAKLILKKIEEINTKNLPVILTGDFNLTPETTPIQYVKQYLRDSKEISFEPPYGPEGTFNNFDFNSILTDRIDYIFVNNKVTVLKYGVLSDSKDNRYPSDHLPVFAKLKLNK
jgi:endonuclease/exonuclease/phosphatase family metal-dependent hydrolase